MKKMDNFKKQELNIDKILYYCDLFKIKKYNINDDGSIDVFEDVDISNKYLIKIPIKFNEVYGDFLCNNTNIVSMKNCPNIIHKNFNMGFNKIKKIEHSPIDVGEKFNLEHNKNLSYIKDFPRNVGSSIVLYSCNFKSLYNLPSIINGSLYIDFNKKLKHLIYSPKKVFGSYSCSYCFLKTLKGGPKWVGGDFNCNCNFLFDLKYSPRYIGGDFIFSGNYISSFYGFPDYVGGDIYCENNIVYTIWCLIRDKNFINYFNQMKIINDNRELNIKKFNLFLKSIGRQSIENVYNYDII